MILLTLVAMLAFSWKEQEEKEPGVEDPCAGIVCFSQYGSRPATVTNTPEVSSHPQRPISSAATCP